MTKTYKVMDAGPEQGTHRCMFTILPKIYKPEQIEDADYDAIVVSVSKGPIDTDDHLTFLPFKKKDGKWVTDAGGCCTASEAPTEIHSPRWKGLRGGYAGQCRLNVPNGYQGKAACDMTAAAVSNGSWTVAMYVGPNATKEFALLLKSLQFQEGAEH